MRRFLDWLHELKIRRALKRKHYTEMVRLINQRSAEQVSRMEQERGLA